jgi:hypothetical protein
MGLLSEQEKAYCRALEALGEKRYATADREFDACRAIFKDGKGFGIIALATKIMARLETEKTYNEKMQTEIEEALDHGEKAVIRGQGNQEKTR